MRYRQNFDLMGYVGPFEGSKKKKKGERQRKFVKKFYIMRLEGRLGKILIFNFT